MRSMVLKAFEQIQATGKVQLFKSYLPEYQDGKQLRDFVYVEDAVKMTLFFLNSKEGGIYNVGTGRSRTWVDMMNAVFHSMDKPNNIEFIEMPYALQGKYQYYTQAQIHQIENLGYPISSISSLEQGVHKYIQYLLEYHQTN